jgi:hypothetical protein
MTDLLLLPVHQPGLLLVFAAAAAIVALDGWLHRR